MTITGIGGYADNGVGGISCTGHGESITRVVLAYDIISLMKYGKHLFIFILSEQ